MNPEPSDSSTPGSYPKSHWKPPVLEELKALLPQYKFLAFIGQGGMGAVYKATQLSLNRPVAIKVLPGSLLANTEANFAARFRLEALTMAKLAHPGIVSVYDSGELPGLLYIVMEYVEGVDIARMIRDSGPLAPGFVIDALGQVCEALGHAHEHGVIHRDLKPANLLVTRAGRVKIADFGLAKRQDDEFLQLTQTNVAIGTQDFLAPEAWTPGASVDSRADLYSMGVTLYQMLTGEVPRGLWKMPSVKAGVNPQFDAVIERAMQDDPGARYQSSAELRRDLASIRLDNPASATGRQPSPPPPRAKPGYRAALGVAALVLLLAAVAGLWRARKPAAGPPLRPVLAFGGGGQYVSVTNFGAIAPASEVTVEFWAYTTLMAQQSVFSTEPDHGSNRFQASINYIDGSTVWDFGVMSPSGRLTTSRAPHSISNWVHYALTASRSGDSMKVYCDGALLSAKSHIAGFVRGAHELRIGGNTESYHGRLAEFRVWDRVRTPAEIKADMANPLTGREPGLVLYYKFDEGAGAVVTNYASASGAAYNGRLHGPAWMLVPEPAAARIVFPPHRGNNRVVSELTDGAPSCLRQAVEGAGPDDVVTFAPSLAGKTIYLTAGEIKISEGITIDASALPGGICIDGNHQYRAYDGTCRIFTIICRRPVQLNSLTFTNGFADRGGAISTVGFAALTNCTFLGNHAAVAGGAIYIYSGGSAALSSCTFSGNEAENGGALFASVYSVATLTNCTITGNRAKTAGGAIFISDSQADLVACTVTGNAAVQGEGGGLAGERSTATLFNSIMAGNSAASDPEWHLREWVVFGLAGSNLTNGPPGLAALGHYGGPTMTMPPLPGSPVLAAGSTGGPAVDQRGLPRPAEARPDIGAVQGLAANSGQR